MPTPLDIERDVAERLNELGVPFRGIFDESGNVVRFFERAYVLIVYDKPGGQIDVSLANIGTNNISSLLC